MIQSFLDNNMNISTEQQYAIRLTKLSTKQREQLKQYELDMEMKEAVNMNNDSNNANSNWISVVGDYLSHNQDEQAIDYIIKRFPLSLYENSSALHHLAQIKHRQLKLEEAERFYELALSLQ